MTEFDRRSCQAYDRICEQKATCFPGMCSRVRDWLAVEAVGDEMHQPLDALDIPNTCILAYPDLGTSPLPCGENGKYLKTRIKGHDN